MHMQMKKSNNNNNGNSLKRRHQNACVVCEDESDGQSLHFGQPTCRACAAFFRRSISQKLHYTCQRNGTCEIDKGARNACRACRFQKCVAQGMLPSAVQNNRELIGSSGLPPLTTPPAATERDNGSGYSANEQHEQMYQPKQSPTSTSSTTMFGSLLEATQPPQYKHLGRMCEGFHQYWAMLKASHAMAGDEFSLMAGIVVGERRPQSRFESSKRMCKVAATLMFDTVERFCWPYAELPLDDKRKIYKSYRPFFCNSLRAYVTSKEYGPGDNRLVMPDGGYVQLDQLYLFFKDSKLVTGEPEQVAKIFHNAIHYLISNVVSHMRNIDIQEMELTALVSMFLWADLTELSSTTLQLARQVRNEIIVDLHRYYRSLDLSSEEITLKTANLFLLIPKLETVVKMMIEDASISDLFNVQPGRRRGVVQGPHGGVMVMVIQDYPLLNMILINMLFIIIIFC